MSKTNTAGRFIWHELVTPDPKAALAFYQELFHWKASTMDMGPGGTYTILKAGDKDVAGVIPAEKAKGIPPHWNLYFTSRDVDATAKQVKEKGGKVMAPPSDIPNVGRFAVLVDPQGSTFSVLAPTDERAETDARPGAGEFCWVSLLIDDPKAALAFYGQVFGWTAKEMPAMNGYQELARADGKPVLGGVMKKEMPGPNAWLQYVVVGDVDATAARASQLKGKVLAPPADIPGIGRFAVLQDPTGAALAVFKAA